MTADTDHRDRQNAQGPRRDQRRAYSDLREQASRRTAQQEWRLAQQVASRRERRQRPQQPR